MKTTFAVGAKAPEKTVDIAPAQDQTTLAKTEQTSTLGLPTQEVQGEFNASDFRIPTLQIVQGVGPLKAAFPSKEGSFVLNKELLLTSANEKLKLTLARYRKQFIENLPYSEENLGQARVVDTEIALYDLGGTLQWKDEIDPKTNKSRRVPPTWVPIVTALVIVEAPSLLSDEPAFNFEFEGKRYAPAIWRIRGTAYNSVGITFNDYIRGFKGNPALSQSSWELQTKYEKRGINFVHVPYAIQLKEKNTDSFRDFVRDITKI